MLIYALGIPIIDGIAGVIVQALENAKGALMIHTMKLQSEIDNSQPEPETNTQVIGFQIPDEYYDEEDYDDDE